MKTTIWLKGKTKSKDAIEYPDCYPIFFFGWPGKRVDIRDIKGVIHGTYAYDNVARMEHRP